MKANTNARRNFTTTLPVPLLRELESAARELGLQKNDIIVEAFTLWNKKRKQALLARSYERVQGKDREELLRLADEGLEEWDRSVPK